MKKKKQLFEEQEIAHWKEHWQGMPEFVQEDQPAFRTLKIHFRNQEDLDKFAELLGIKISEKTRFFWFPLTNKNSRIEYQYVDES